MRRRDWAHLVVGMLLPIAGACGPATQALAPPPISTAPATAPTAAAAPPSPATVRDERMDMGRFGHGTYLEPTPANGSMVLLLATNAAWHGAAGSLAWSLAERGAVVAELDLDAYQQRLAAGAQDACSWPTIDFQAMTKKVGKAAGFGHFVEPVLVGLDEAAPMVVAAVAQAKPDMFRGVVTTGFCARLALPRPPCAGANELGWEASSTPGRGRIVPPKSMPAPWLSFKSRERVRCPSAESGGFVNKTPAATLARLDAASGEAPTALVEAIAKLAAAPPRAATGVDAHGDVDDLPLIEMPATADETDAFAVFVSGDGGWASLDEQVAAYLNAHGLPVVGLSEVRYFWTQRTPEEVARDFARITRHYLQAWGKRRVLWVGYSAGADAFGLVTARMPAELLAKVAAVALIGPGTRADFEFHITDWLPGERPHRGVPLLPEVMKIQGLPLVCVSGTEETVSLCPLLPAGHATHVVLSGGHHFGGDYDGIGKAILDAANVH